MGSPTLQTLEDPILLLPWRCFAFQTLYKRQPPSARKPPAAAASGSACVRGSGQQGVRGEGCRPSTHSGGVRHRRSPYQVHPGGDVPVGGQSTIRVSQALLQRSFGTLGELWWVARIRYWVGGVRCQKTLPNSSGADGAGGGVGVVRKGNGQLSSTSGPSDYGAEESKMLY
jgi:hypothetical protein